MYLTVSLRQFECGCEGLYMLNNIKHTVHYSSVVQLIKNV